MEHSDVLYTSHTCIFQLLSITVFSDAHKDKPLKPPKIETLPNNVQTEKHLPFSTKSMQYYYYCYLKQVATKPYCQNMQFLCR